MSPATAQGWETLFWALFERSANPVALLDEQQRILEVNESALELFGYTRGCLIGSELPDLVTPEERLSAVADWQTLVRTGEHAGATTLVHRDGSSVLVEWSARLVRFPGRNLALVTAAAVPAPEDDYDARPPDGEALTVREREVVGLIALGESTDDIARQLFISPQTVKTHIRNAMHKLGARSRAHLVAVSLLRREVSVAAPQRSLPQPG